MSPLTQPAARLGLFGGSFDPVHAGHLHAARAALEAFALTRVVFVPARLPPHKPGRSLASGADRLAMLHLAVQGEPRYAVDALELARPGPSYTIDTVRALPAALGEAPDVPIYLILGSDNVEGLAAWRDSAALLERVQPVIVHREGEPRAAIESVERALGPAAAEKVRAGYLRLPAVPVSSTGIRARLARAAGGAAEIELAPAVLEYIRSHGLYGAGT